MSDRLLAATRKGLFFLERAPGVAGDWRIAHVAFLGDNVNLAYVDGRDGSVYAALNLGHFGAKLRRSRDGGKQWTELAAPAYPVDAQVTTGDGKPPIPATLSQIWSLEGGGADRPGRLWAGTIPGGLFRSEDQGETWQLNAALWAQPERSDWFGGGYDQPGIHSICVDPRDGDTLRLAVSCGGVWISRDGGASWALSCDGMFAEYMPPERRRDASIQDPHRMVQCAGAPQRLWIQHHNGVFCSADGGAIWTEVAQVKPSVFGFAVAVHPHDPDTAWFVPAVKDDCRVPVDARLVVSRTRDGGRSFEVLNHGLPPEPTYDLVYRHGMAIDAQGTQLAIGSTSGGLWTSDDGGEHWQGIGARLPPIYALTFG